MRRNCNAAAVEMTENTKTTAPHCRSISEVALQSKLIISPFKPHRADEEGRKSDI